MKTLFEKFINEILSDEDGEELQLNLNPGATMEEIRDCQEKNNFIIPEDYVQLLLFANGMDFFGVQINSLEELYDASGKGNFEFHNWGNGDFDYISRDNKIYFENHSMENAALISASLQEWFTNVFNEIKEFGVLFHPMDEMEGAMYSDVEYD